MSLWLQLIANGVITGSLFAVLACSFGLVYRSMRLFHIAHAGLFVVAAYVFFIFREWAHWPVWLAMFASVVAASGLGWMVEKWFYGRFFLRAAGSGAVMVASMGLFIVIENAVALIFGNETQVISRESTPRHSLGPIALEQIQLVQFLTASMVLVGFSWAARRLRTFKAIWAMGDEPGLVPVLGMPIMRYRSIVFMLSGAMGAVAACLIGWDTGIHPQMGISYLLIAAVAVLVGGTDRYAGWILGGFILALLQSFVTWRVSAIWVDLFTFSILIGVLTFRPQGVFGSERRLEEAGSPAR